MGSDAVVLEATKYLTKRLLGLINKKDWNRLEASLSNPTSFKLVSDSVSKEFNGKTFLHACIRYNPPTQLVEKMIKMYPEVLKSVDCHGRTPLHVAAGSRASSTVIKLLTMKNPQACKVQDESGCTPLHYACNSACNLFGDDEPSSPRRRPCLHTIRHLLLLGTIEAVTYEDKDEMNALEYAIVSDASLEVVDLLQISSQRVMKKANSNRNAQGMTIPHQPMSIMASSMKMNAHTRRLALAVRH